MEKTKWCERLFGKRLIKCDSADSSDDFHLASTEEVLQNANTVGIYFSFANINLQSDEVIKKLRDLYERLRNESSGEAASRKFEVIQVVMWAHNDNYGDFESSHRDSLQGLPWLAMPYSETVLKTRLSRRYRIKSGVPTLVLLDREGATISISAQERLIEDPSGTYFPWRPRPVDDVLKDVVLQPGGLYPSEHKNYQNYQEDVHYSDLPHGIRGFYFSANWCPPGRAFTPQLVEAYQVIRKKDPSFEVIFVSSDRSAESYRAYTETMPWLSVPFQQTAVRAELAELYGIRGIPTLLLLDNNGHIITRDARSELADDPLVENFPWKPKAVNILTDRFLTSLHDYPAVVLFVDGEETEVQFAESVLVPAAECYYESHNINLSCVQEGYFLDSEDDSFLQFFVGVDNELSDVLRELIGLDDVVPLLVALDLPNTRYAVMEYGLEITNESVDEFVRKLQKDELKYVNMTEERVEALCNFFFKI